jgi:membrane protease YdiL (CAAX protease family)
MRLKELFTGSDRDTVGIFLTAGVAIALYLTVGSAKFAAPIFGCAVDAPRAVIWQFLAGFGCFGLLPIAAWKLWLRRPLGEIGLCAGDLRGAIRLFGFLAPIVVVLMWVGSMTPDVRLEYPLATGLDGEPGKLSAYLGAYLLFYLGWETLYRGFLILGLTEKLGAFPAVGLSMLVTTAIHVGKPQGEIWGSLLVGIVFGWMAIRYRSILLPLLLHATVGFATDLFVLFGPGSLR